ncbi:MAG: hypothetical protein IK079_05430, partial [Desulfovibrio sp.]|nr:hypothetical protein [Desulfovibrio sp.]
MQNKSIFRFLEQQFNFVFTTLGFVMVGIPPMDAQASDLSDLFSKISTVSKDAGNALKVVFFITGIFFVGAGIMKLIQASERREPKGPGLTY